MDLIDPIVTIAEKLYSLCSEVKANKQRCQRLASRVSGLVELVQTMKQQGLGNQPKIVERGLRELKLTLESAQEVVKKYISTGFLKLICKAFEFGEEFSSLNERLNDAEQLLSLALQAHQRKRIEDLFEESRRRREDEEDKQRDCQELEKLLRTLTEETKEGISDVKDTVDQTQRDVQEIKVMLETLKRPSIHQETIREIRPEELTYDVPIKPIMKSNDSEVFEGEYNKFTVAIKRYTYPLNTNPSEVRKIFSKEVETMRRFESPNILRMFGICVQNENGPNPEYLIVMEFCEKGSLRQVLDSNCRLTWAIKAQMCLDAAQGIYRLHQSEQKFKVHGCINSSKFLVAAGYRVKLGGFELAKTETSLRRTKSGRSSIYYSSPQQLQSIHYSYDKPCEIYSFGIVLWEIATRENPFEGCSRDDVYRKVYTEQIIEPLPQDCPQQLAELINACRSFEPFHRPTAGVLVDKLRKVAEQIKED
ncbi:mixed lineage kinase domain-like protein [Chanos chanos]|uniref:Mixed lineage kinase domain-like protein n=1 Tax=Chanos chanos TaxID=29144 RepID=A0A6J2UTM4_CHACN|nr:mixed lineage kinase domain-like protein [Chanos chanos]